VCGIVPVAVSIAIPTFNRRGTLRRAVESALSQTHEDVEVVVSDNASTDGTGELLREIAAGDSRLRVVRQTRNLGMVANLESAARLAEGEHVMLLADDDWIAPRCVEVALAGLRTRPDRSAVLGRVAYMRGGTEVEAGQPAALTAPDPAQRVRDYFAAVDRDHGNTWLYGLARRELVQRLTPLRNVLGFDWLRVAELAFLGPIDVLEETLIFRELGGASETTAQNVRESRLPAMQARAPHFVIAREVMADIGWRSPVYARLRRARRLSLAAACAAGVPGRNLGHVLFHLAPTGLQQHRRRRS